MALEKFLATFDTAICTEIATAIEFGGRTFKPDPAKAMLEAKICHTLPNVNSKGRGFSAATLANSYKSAELQLVDFDHRLSFYSAKDEDRVCGTIAAIDFPDKDDAMESESGGTAVPLRALLVAYRKAKGVEQMLEDIKSEKYNWRTSVEIEYKINTAALYDLVDKKWYPLTECSSEMRKIITETSVGKWKGHEMAFCPGGEDGKVIVSGCAFTRWPADKNATLEQLAASDKPSKIIVVNSGWKSDTDYRSAVASAAAGTMLEKEAPPLWNRKKPAKLADFLTAVATLPPLHIAKEYAKAVQEITLWNNENPNELIDVSEVFKANPIIGHTDDGGKDKHKHAITKNLMVLPAGGHGHYMGMMSAEKESDGLHLCGCTSSRGGYEVSSDGTSTYGEHCHTFDLGGMSFLDMSGVGGKEVEAMDIKERIKVLRETAQTLATSNPTESKRLRDLADVTEKEHASEGVEEIIAARIKNGDLIPKVTHENTVATARKEGEAAATAKVEADKKADAEKATTLASRIEAVKKAKIDVNFALGKTRTVQSEVASIPVGEEGDKKFAERLEEWTIIAEKSGQMRASAEDSVRPPVASTNTDGTQRKEKKHGKLGVC